MGQIVNDVTQILDYKKEKKEAKSARKEILEQMAENEKQKINLVKKNIAAQRAKYGAAGMSNKGMTEGAVLNRLKAETEEPFEKQRLASMEKLKKIKVNKPNLLKSIVSRFDQLL